MASDLDFQFIRAQATPSDINEHIETFRSLGSECTSVLEVGVRTAVSSWGWLKGLAEAQTKSGRATKLMGCDLEHHGNINLVRNAAKSVGVEYGFFMGNGLSFPFAHRYDAIFIDSFHVYQHLKNELKLFAPQANKYLAMHDTTIDEIYGEAIRCRFNVDALMRETGYPREGICRGLWPAVEEFLADSPEWVLHKRYTNNNGLTILKRVTPLDSQEVIRPYPPPAPVHAEGPVGSD